MVRTAIRPDDYVEFRDPATHTVVFSTADSSRVYLSELDEGTAEVKSITVDVPAADGALDLTESVAGRPLYGNRTVTMTVSLVCADHPAAVAAVQSARRAIHGRMLEVETPDTRVSEGWYAGRVSIDSVEYPGEAAVLHITADCKPWVYYGTETVQLTSGTPRVITDWGIRQQGANNDISTAVIGIEQPEGIWDTNHNYAYAGLVPQSVALVASPTLNLWMHGTMGNWVHWSMDGDETGADWSASWTRDTTEYDEYITYEQDGSDTSDSHKAHRWLIMSTAGTDGAERGLMVTGVRDIIRVWMTVRPITFGRTILGTTSRIAVFVQGSRRPDGPADASGGLLQNGLTESYVNVWQVGDSTSERTVHIDIDPLDYVDGSAIGSDLPAGYLAVGLETRWVGADINWLHVELLPRGLEDLATDFVDGDSTMSTLAAAAPLYSSGDYRNAIEIAPWGTSMTAPLEVPAGSDTVSPVTPAPVYALARPAIDESLFLLRAYGITNRGWMGLKSTVTLYPWSTATFDAGDMPTALEAALGAPVLFEVGDERFTVTASGTLPFALAGEVELPYMAMGADGTLTFERGTV